MSWYRGLLRRHAFGARSNAGARPRRLRRIVLASGGVLMALTLTTAAWFVTPPADDVLAPPSSLGVTLTDRDGTPLRDTRAANGERWRWVPLAEMDPVVTAAFIAAEDRQFLSHGGVAWPSLARAVRDNLLGGRVVSGASTITMQLARLLRGQPRTVLGKVQQIAWALRLEHHVSKTELLEQYLNRVPLGQGTVGVEAAAKLYFGTSIGRLGAGRAALLAGIARSPARNNPMAAPEQAARRRATVLGALRLTGYLSARDSALASAEPVAPAWRRALARFRAPHFTTRVLATLEGERAGWSATSPASATVRTTLHYPLQRAIERDTRQVVQSLAEQRVQHAAVVVLDNASGDVLAWVGSPDFAGPSGQVDMVVSRRQPGSALKPFLYALAFERGYGPSTILDDLPRTYMTSTGPYRPRNYDRQFRGPVRARVALASSLNLPAVQLTDELGAAAFLDVLHRAGFASLTQSAEHYGVGLSLGNGDVTLLELANAYRSLANGGVRTAVRRLLEPSRASATSAREATVQPTRVVRADVAALTLDILNDPDARLAGFGDATVFDFPFATAVKTGTSRHFTDNWAVAVTGGFTVAVWVGNFDGTPMAAVSGISGAGPLLRRAVLATADFRPAGSLPAPDRLGATRVLVCRVSGMAAVRACDATNEWQLASQQPLPPDSWHRDGAVVLPTRFAEWQRQQVEQLGAQTTAARSLAARDGATRGDRSAAETLPLRLLSPRDGDVYRLPSGPARRVATVALHAIGNEADATLTWSVDDQPIAGGRWKLEPGEHTVRVTAPSGASAEARIEVRGAGRMHRTVSTAGNARD